MVVHGKNALPSINDDLLTQIMFVDELDAVFGTAARTSLSGQVQQSVQQAARSASKSGAADLAAESVGKIAEKARGINEENAFKSIRDVLLSSQVK